MKYSVLLSVYAKEKAEYFKQCLNSVFLSTVKPSEVVIVKDGPVNEELEKVIEDFCRVYNTIKVVGLEKNSGLGIALNEGLKHCENELVARMDTDDICVSDRFEKQLKAFENNAGVSVVGGYITEFIDSPENIISTRKVPCSTEEIKNFGKNRNPINHVTVMFKKQDIQSVGGYRKVKDIGYEDYDLWIRLIVSGKQLINIDDVLVNVRVGNDMYKRRGDKKRLATALYFRKKMWEIGYCSFGEFIISAVKTIAFSCAPAFVRKYAYKVLLRK